MRLTRQSEIAIAILAACAGSAGKAIRTKEAAEAAEATTDHAAQVVSDLAREGFLRTTRGCQGGIALAVPPREILLGDVLRHMQPDLGRHIEARDNGEPAAPSVAFRAIVGGAEAAFLTFMDRFSIADLVSDISVKRAGCLDCELLNPARRRRGPTAPSSASLHHQPYPALRLKDDSRIDPIAAERTRRERSPHHVTASR